MVIPLTENKLIEVSLKYSHVKTVESSQSRKWFPLRFPITCSVAPFVVSSQHHMSQCGDEAPPVCAMRLGS